ncbi:MAG TPA: tetratricopeptide repeat protein [Bryobacteraceae bacterium]|nr:tetratricopeptide repeat protein [Bryobacteraceae bacterium]
MTPGGSARMPAIGGGQPLIFDKRILIVAIFLSIGGAGYLLKRASSAAVPAQVPFSSMDAAVAAAQAAVKQHASPENYVNLSLAYSKARRFQESLEAAKTAIRLRPNYAEAFNNEAAAYEDLHQWDNAIAAAREALRLKPDFALARNNLIYAASQKARAR